MTRRLYQRGQELHPGDRILSRVRPLECVLEVARVGRWHKGTREVMVRQLPYGEKLRWIQRKVDGDHFTGWLVVSIKSLDSSETPESPLCRNPLFGSGRERNAPCDRSSRSFLRRNKDLRAHTVPSAPKKPSRPFTAGPTLSLERSTKNPEEILDRG